MGNVCSPFTNADKMNESICTIDNRKISIKYLYFLINNFFNTNISKSVHCESAAWNMYTGEYTNSFKLFLTNYNVRIIIK